MRRDARMSGRLVGFAVALLLCAFDWPQRTARIVDELAQTRDLVTRCDLVRLLAKRPDSEAESALIALLEDPRAELRREVAWALGRRGTLSAQSALIKALTDADGSVRTAAAEGLGSARSDISGPALIRALGDANSETRAAAATALGRVLADTITVQVPGATQEQSDVSPIAVAIDDEAPEVRMAAARTLAMLVGQEAVPALLAKLHDPSADMRQLVLLLLVQIDPSHVEPLLMQALDDTNEAVQLEALRGFSVLPLPRQAETIARLQMLERRGRPQLANAARVLLQKPLSARAPEGARRQAAQESADWIALLTRTETANAGSSEVLLAELERALPPGAELAVDPLVLWLAQAPKPLRGRIAELIRQATPKRCHDVLPLIRDEDPAVRRAGARSLASCSGPEALPALFAALNDVDTGVAWSAAHGLAAQCDASTFTELSKPERWQSANSELEKRLTLVTAGCLEHVAPDVLDSKSKADLEQRLLSQFENIDSDSGLASLSARALAFLPSDRTASSFRRVYETAALPLRVAILRASVRDRSPQSRALRALANDAPQPAIAATARVAAWLARDPSAKEPATVLGERAGRDLSWPLGPVTAFLLASSTLESPATPAQAAALCSALGSPEPITRANASARFARSAPTSASAPRPASPCQFTPAGSAPTHPLGRTSEALVPSGPASARGSREDDTARTPGSLHALVLADGRILVSVADGSGAVSWQELPHIVTENPWHRPYGTE
jgi:HEAT repeat protein